MLSEFIVNNNTSFLMFLSIQLPNVLCVIPYYLENNLFCIYIYATKNLFLLMNFSVLYFIFQNEINLFKKCICINPWYIFYLIYCDNFFWTFSTLLLDDIYLNLKIHKSIHYWYLDRNFLKIIIVFFNVIFVINKFLNIFIFCIVFKLLLKNRVMV